VNLRTLVLLALSRASISGSVRLVQARFGVCGSSGAGNGI
jgi:hypothetical protein